MSFLPFLIVLWLSRGTRTKLFWKFEVIIKPHIPITSGGQLSYSMLHGSIGQSVLAGAPPTLWTSNKISATASKASSRVSA